MLAAAPWVILDHCVACCSETAELISTDLRAGRYGLKIESPIFSNSIYDFNKLLFFSFLKTNYRCQRHY